MCVLPCGVGSCADRTLGRLALGGHFPAERHVVGNQPEQPDPDDYADRAAPGQSPAATATNPKAHSPVTSVEMV